jgi:hypothetical protein
MRTAATAGRIVGALIIVQMVAGVLVNFVLTAPLFGSPGFLVSAASHSLQIGLSVLLGLAMTALSVGIAIIMFPVIRQDAPGTALWLLALASVSLAITAVEQINVLSMLSLSEAYGKAVAGERVLPRPAHRGRLGTQLVALRRSGHCWKHDLRTLQRVVPVPVGSTRTGCIRHDSSSAADHRGRYAAVRDQRCVPHAGSIGGESVNSGALAHCEGLSSTGGRESSRK